MKTTFNAQTGRFGPIDESPGTPTGTEPPPVVHDVGTKSFAPPSLSTPSLYLRTLQLSDYAPLQMAETSGELGVRWRFSGATPSPEQWIQRTWSGVLAQFLVIDRATDHPIGIVVCYEPSHQHGHAKIAAARLDGDTRSPGLVVGLAVFLRYVLTVWDFRKLYMELPEYNLPQFQSGVGKLFDVESRLIDHFYYGGQYWDALTLAIYRESCLENCERVLETGTRGQGS